MNEAQAAKELQISKSTLSRWRKDGRIRRDAGLGQDVVAKTIRHTVATHLRTVGVSEAEIQGMLGHKAYSGKTEVYAKYRPDYLGHACAAIHDYLTEVTALRAC